MLNPVISVLTTVYNREKFLEDCIKSVLSSDFHNLELIIVDDQSQDNSYLIAQKYALLDKRIKTFINPKNLGDYLNRNQAVSYANGKYIKFLDADDLIYPHGLRIMVETMESFPECALGISQEVAEDVMPFPFVMKPEETFRREFLRRGVLGVGPTGTIFRKDAFDSLGGFSGTRYIGDTEMWYKMALRYPVVKMVPGLVYWRQHDDQEFSKGSESFFYLENSFKHKMNFLNRQDFPLNSQEKDIAEKKLKKRFSRNIIRLVKEGRFLLANKIRTSCQLSWIEIIKSI